MEEAERVCPLEATLNVSAINEVSEGLYHGLQWICQINGEACLSFLQLVIMLSDTKGSHNFSSAQL